MQRRGLKLIIFLILIVSIFIVWHVVKREPVKQSTPNTTSSTEKKSASHQKNNIQPDTQAAQLLLAVNKKHPLPTDYNPYGGSSTSNNADGAGLRPEVKTAKDALISAMQQAGFHISNHVSGFRSYAYQSQLYQNYVSAQGQAKADTFSARPGYSEHQSGLAFDLLGNDGQLPTDDRMYAWLQEHAHKYGFIIRFPRDSSDVTGYQGEEWHVRYIGEKFATEMYNKHIKTLEAFTGVTGGNYNADSKQDIPALAEYDQKNQHALNPRP
ncbi:M15 family metallopeptidase [Weissella diestrammenae]|uniref:M15 family metallopeptidase n=1 Tax=Weissella diestrammenae TaxID=1162633 RepID=A0A7G9T5F3_9LACO|nr:M15 family metallopeptidase [Weissella diestrammenae]MCM0583187.1 M15 family metallopeptidase [Weissella diestrammenae]QNN75328.1 M15 family metallopeptidase [Weissella diestrammenae]